MKTSRHIAASMALIALASCSESTSSGESQGSPFSISGRVVTVDSAPLAGVAIHLNKANLSATSDQKGNWTISGTLTSSASGPDTIEYRVGGKLFLRDTISVKDASGIVRAYDTTWNPAIIYGYLLDARDNQIYRTVKIGKKIWMAQNLNYAADSSWWYSGTEDIDAPTKIDENQTKGRKYGRLYSWRSLVALPDSCADRACFKSNRGDSIVRGVCPSEWHVATDSEWIQLLRDIDATPGVANRNAIPLKSVPGWGTSDTAKSDDKYGFRALPGGGRWPDGGFATAGYMAMWWSSGEPVYSAGGRYTMVANRTYTDHAGDDKHSGMSARCVHD